MYQYVCLGDVLVKFSAVSRLFGDFYLHDSPSRSSCNLLLAFLTCVNESVREGGDTTTAPNHNHNHDPLIW